MQVKAATLTLTAHVDIDTLTPSLALSIELDEACSFLADQRDVLAGWLEKAARDLRA